MTMMPNTKNLNQLVTTKPQNLRENCTAIFWLKNSTHNDNNEKLMTELNELTGVGDIQLMTKHPTILKVAYCSKKIRAAQMVSASQDMGFNLRQIGC